MKKSVMIKTAGWLLWVLANVVFLMTGCGGSSAPQTEPTPPPPPPVVKEPSIEELRKPVTADAEIFKAHDVLKKFGKAGKKHLTYEKYQAQADASASGAVDPDWFCDSYNLNMNEKNHWATFTYGTAEAAKDKDPRIAQLMANLPDKSIIVKLKTPDGKKYILSDANADGILDFAKEEARNDARLDIKLLDVMQEKYTWLLGVIKKYYNQK